MGIKMEMMMMMMNKKVELCWMRTMAMVKEAGIGDNIMTEQG